MTVAEIAEIGVTVAEIAEIGVNDKIAGIVFLLILGRNSEILCFYEFCKRF
jgi:hypothetical protein